MKHTFFHIILTVVLLSSLCGCNQSTVTEHATISDLVETEKKHQDNQNTENEPLENDDTTEEIVTPVMPEITKIQFDDRNYTNVKLHDVSKADYLSVPQTYSELKNWLEYDGGIIVAGYAYGKRNGYLEDEVYTLTKFQIEKIYMGQVEQPSICIRENYCPNIINDEEVIMYQGHKFTQLKDGQRTLLYLLPTRETGVYEPIYYEIPLPEDYQSFNDAEKNEILDYYRGKPSVYKKTEGDSYSEMIQNPDGTVTITHHIVNNNYWPERNLSNADLLKEMQDHILLQTVAEYNIKIWPQGHIRYSAKENPFSNTGIALLSHPN